MMRGALRVTLAHGREPARTHTSKRPGMRHCELSAGTRGSAEIARENDVESALESRRDQGLIEVRVGVLLCKRAAPNKT